MMSIRNPEPAESRVSTSEPTRRLAPESEGDVTELEVLSIERACEKLVALYTHRVDFGEAERVAELFHEDGVWEVGDTRFEGREAVRGMLRSRQEMKGRRSRHVCTNLVIDVVDPDHATGLVYLSLYRHDFESAVPDDQLAPGGPPVAVGQYRDRFVRTKEGWRFACRRAELAFGAL